MATLYCPKCSYNLTGLPEDRCPECGAVFDRAALEKEYAERAKPITLKEVLWRLMLPPAAYLLLAGLAVFSRELGVVLLIVGGLVLLVYGLVNSIQIAKRLAVTGGDDSRGPKVRTAFFIPLCAVGLYCCQLAIGFGGCTAVTISNLKIH